MDEKMFNLLETMYADLTSKIDNIDKEIKAMKINMATKEDLSKVEQALKHDIVKFENKMDENHKALYEGYKLTYEKLEIMDNKVDEINENVEKQDLEIRVIKGVK